MHVFFSISGVNMIQKYQRISDRKKWENKDMQANIVDVARKASSLNGAALKNLSLR